MQAFDKYAHSNGRYGLKKFYSSLKITLKWLQGITLFKDFETIFAFNILNSLTDHYFGQILSRLVVFLSDDEVIFLLLFETKIRFKLSFFAATRSFLMFVFLLGELLLYYK